MSSANLSISPFSMQIMPWKQHRHDSVQRGVTLRDAMNQLFDESFWDPMRLFSDSVFSPALTGHSFQFFPSFDIAETKNELQIIADVPGYDPKNIKVHIDNGVLTIEGTMEEHHEEKDNDTHWYCKQAARGNFVKRFSLPDGVTESSTSCKLKNGKLSITIQKPEVKEAKRTALPIDIE